MDSPAKDDRDRAIGEFFKALTALIRSCQPLVDDAIEKAGMQKIRQGR
jgi:hypothetical protein